MYTSLHNLLLSLTVEQLSRSFVTTKSTFQSVIDLQMMYSWAQYCKTPPSSSCWIWQAASLSVDDCCFGCCPRSESKACLDDSSDSCCRCCFFCCELMACLDDLGNCCCCCYCELMACPDWGNCRHCPSSELMACLDAGNSGCTGSTLKDLWRGGLMTIPIPENCDRGKLP